MSAKIGSDQFLLYAFDGVADDTEAVLARLRHRASLCSDFAMRVDDRGRFRYPNWVAVDTDSSTVKHNLDDASWAGCLKAVAELADHQLDCRVRPWRLHLFAPVQDVPASSGPATVAVLQIAHALADGTRASGLAAWLFGRPGGPPALPNPARGRWIQRARAAAEAHRRLVDDTEQGRVPAQGPSRSLLVTNAPPSGAREIRTVVRARSALAGASVTVAVLAAVGAALQSHLGVEAPDMGAEVPMVKPGTPLARNHFRNVGVGLYPTLPWNERIPAIDADLTARRLRAQHPAARANDLAFAAVPAALLRWGIAQFETDVRSPTVGGNTVVSSVNRGAADLRFGSAPVVLTAGYPALSPMMGLVHGVHGIGDTVAISVHGAQSAVGDIDAYVAVLADALDRRC